MSAPGGSGEGGAALACGSLWQAGRRGSGRVTSTRGRSRGCRAPRSRRALQAPAAATKKGGRAEEAERRRKRRRGDSGMFPQDRGHQGGEGTGLEPLTDPPPISVPPSFLTALPLSSQTEPPCNLSPLPLLLGGFGCPELPRLPCVCVRRVAVPCFWELSPESNPGP